MRYRKLSTRLWADERFRRLSGPAPNAQSLFLYLMTGPHTTSLPGLFVAGEASLAEAIGWPMEGFRKAFRELLQEGFEEGHTYPLVMVDYGARLIFLPRAIRHNAPENPNVVKGWREQWTELPECDLKDAAWHILSAEIRAKSEACGKAFDACIEAPKGTRKPFGKPFAYALPKAMPNQEQEQEQEQEQIKNLAPPKMPEVAGGELFSTEPASKPKRGRPPKNPEAHAAERADADRWLARVRSINGLPPEHMAWTTPQFMAFRRLRKAHGIDALMDALDGLADDKFSQGNGLGWFTSASAFQKGIANKTRRAEKFGTNLEETWERYFAEEAAKKEASNG